jgi:hypothetical protein
MTGGRPSGAALLLLGPSSGLRADREKEHAATQRLEG